MFAVAGADVMGAARAASFAGAVKLVFGGISTSIGVVAGVSVVAGAAASACTGIRCSPLVPVVVEDLWG